VHRGRTLHKIIGLLFVAIMGKKSLAKRKTAIVERIILTGDEQLLAAIEGVLKGSSGYCLSADQVRSLDASVARYLRGEGQRYAWSEVEKRALRPAKPLASR